MEKKSVFLKLRDELWLKLEKFHQFNNDMVLIFNYFAIINVLESFYEPQWRIYESITQNLKTKLLVRRGQMRMIQVTNHDERTDMALAEKATLM
eukprot:7222848-Karenia_brevis.AAC.1